MEPYRSDWLSVPGTVNISATKVLIQIADNEPIKFRLDSFYDDEGCVKYNVTTLLSDSYNAAYITVCDDYIYLIELGDIVLFKVSKVKKL